MNFSIQAMQQDPIDENSIYLARVVGKGSYLCRQYSCTIGDCRYSHGKVGVIENHLKLHDLKDMNQEEYDVYHCKICDFLSLEYPVFKRHEQSHGEKQYKCSKCSTMLKYKDSLTRHQKTQHAQIKKPRIKRKRNKK